MVRLTDSDLFTTGTLLAFFGGLLSFLDVLFAGCVGSMPCQAVPPFPIFIPLAAYAVGATLVVYSAWSGRSKTR